MSVRWDDVPERRGYWQNAYELTDEEFDAICAAGIARRLAEEERERLQRARRRAFARTLIFGTLIALMLWGVCGLGYPFNLGALVVGMVALVVVGRGGE